MESPLRALLALSLASLLTAQNGPDVHTDGSRFAEPVRLEADGEPIDIGKLSKDGHAGPWIADVDGDGDRDLVVGDFPGHFWLFENTGTDEDVRYAGRGKLQAGGEAAKTPIY